MKKPSCFFFISMLACIVSFAQRNSSLFDSAWKFQKGELQDGEKFGIDDKGWRTVELPHDWSIEDLPGQSDSVIGPFSAKSIGTTATGYTVGGTAWYRKHFNVPNSQGKSVSIYFDGVYMNSDIWINEHHLGNHPYGYTPFYFDISPWLRHDGKENLIAVRVRNEGKNTRWYSGSGIYRHVWITTSSPAHIRQWGVYITTPNVSSVAATLNVSTTIVDSDATPALSIRTTVYNAANEIVATLTSSTIVTRPEKSFVTGWTVESSTRMNRPVLWSPDTPYLYHAVTSLLKDKNIIDEVVTNFGVRKIEVSATKGLLINGKNIKLKGGCVHHDNGPLGSAAIDRAEERRVELLKSFGYNAIRTSHNPPSAAFLDACDRLGILVLDEFTDMWETGNNPDDYHRWFHEWWQRDLDAMLMRDRNHPSVIFWSIGNEIKERGDSSGIVIGARLAREVHRIDPTRPVTEAVCEFWDHPGRPWDSTARAFALLDVDGYNYQYRRYEADHEKFPARVMMGTESVAKEALGNWQQVEKHPYVIGDFVWTAMDYLGETGIGHTSPDSDVVFVKTWPWFNSWCGDIDLTGGKKPQSYYRDIVWRRTGINMLVHQPLPEGHKEAVSFWGWPDEVPFFTFPGAEGKTLPVNIYTRYPSVRLLLNGKLVGEKTVSADNLTASFEIKYEPGELKAVAIDGGKPVDSVMLQSAGTAKQIKLIADRKTIRASRNDLSYVTVQIIDGKGQLVPNNSSLIHFTISGAGDIAATASASPDEMQSFQKPMHKIYRGTALVIIRPHTKPGKIILKAEGENLAPATIEITVE